MKKLLIASTALVASAGFAAAEMSLSGEANMGVKYDSGLASKETRVYNEIDFSVAGSGTTDAGLTFGASIDLDDRHRNGVTGQQALVTGINSTATSGVAVTTTGGAVVTLNVDTSNQGIINDAEVFVSGDFGSLTIGGVAVADDAMAVIQDLGFDGVGVDDVVEGLLGEGNITADVEYAGGFGGLTLIATFHDMNEDYSIVAKYDFGAFEAGLGYSRDEAAADEIVSASIEADLGMAAVDALYVDNQVAGVEGWGLSATFDAGVAKVVVSMADTDVAGVDASYGIGFKYSLGGGATLAGGIAKIDNGATEDTVADLGVTMEF